MDLQINRFACGDTIGNLKQTRGLLTAHNGIGVVYQCWTLERPDVGISRIPEGTYSYRVINQTPDNTLAHIRIDNKCSICVDSYTDLINNIMVGEFDQRTYYLDMINQREHLRKLCSILPETGFINIYSSELLT